MDEEVLGRCHAILFNSLDTSLISPLLYSNKLLTSNEYDMLESPIRSHSDKIRSLLSILPGKDQWFDKFLDCLKETSDGTGHCKIVRELEHAKRDIENRKKVTTSSVEYHGLLEQATALGSSHSNTDQDSLQLSRIELLEQKPKMTDLTKIVIPFIQAEWETIGYMLHCDIHTIIAIGEKYSNNPSKCCREVLKDWLTSDRGVHSKTWSTLLNVIGQLPELADVKKKIITRLHKLQL